VTLLPQGSAELASISCALSLSERVISDAEGCMLQISGLGRLQFRHDSECNRRARSSRISGRKAMSETGESSARFEGKF